MNRQNYTKSIKFSGNNRAPQIWCPESGAYTSTPHRQLGVMSSFPERRAGSAYT